MNINVLSVMAKYDKKTTLYEKKAQNNREKKEIKFSTFSGVDELNASVKRTFNEAKVGDKRNIVDFLGFYDECVNKEINDKDKIKIKSK